MNQSGGRAVSLSAERATDVSSNVHSRQPTPRADPFRCLPPRAARAGAAPVRRSGGPAVRRSGGPAAAAAAAAARAMRHGARSF